MSYFDEPRTERNRQIVLDMQKGMGATAIAEKYGITKQYASLLYNKYIRTDSELPRSKKANEILNELIRGELTHSEIAKKLKASPNTVSTIKRRFKHIILKQRQEAQDRIADPCIRAEWLKDMYCSGCGKRGVIRVRIENASNSMGISLCQRCINLLHDEVIHKTMAWGVVDAK